MGRITVFSTSTCPHCKRAKGLLTSKGWEYVEVSLSDYPEKRTAMLQLADKLSVPQIFFNEKHLGGASELAALDEQGQLDALYEEMAAAPEPADERLAKPDYAPPPPPEPPIREAEPPIALAAGEDAASATYPEIAAQLASELAIDSRTFRASVYHNCFVGAEAVDVLMKLYALLTREEAVGLGLTLQQAGMFDHVVEGSDHPFKDELLFYRLQAHASPKTLNSSRKWKGVAEGAVPCAIRLKKSLSKILDSFTDDDGKVDYLAARDTPQFAAFSLASCELQAVDYLSLEPKAKLAFSINVYNMMISHAFVQLGTPSSATQRNGFFGGVCYNIAGQVFSFGEIEHGMLRSNCPVGLAIKKPSFGPDDPRLAFVLPLDNRIHFALNCGASSCPPVKTFSPEAVLEELRVVTMVRFDCFSIVSCCCCVQNDFDFQGIPRGRRQRLG